MFEDSLPATEHGAILVSTRRHKVASRSAEQSLEVMDFTIENGAKFVLHLLQSPEGMPEEERATKDLSELLHDYALATAQLTAYMNARKMPVEGFLSRYKKTQECCIVNGRKVGNISATAKPLTPLETSRSMLLTSFANACLRFLSFYSPDSVPIALLKSQRNLALPVLVRPKSLWLS